MDSSIEAILAQDLAPKERARALNELGKTLFAQRDEDGAIACWEKSVACYGKPGPAQAQLMKAYNLKRRQCSERGDSAGIETFSQKIDALMQQSKDAIRYGF
ncbi:hypothetical protein [Acerihabitans sp.]|uniref:hypothetical protein n=1 Tax=Acerihabitans sp. TaxID=2811394 RepID=UPI002ED880AA